MPRGRMAAVEAMLTMAPPSPLPTIAGTAYFEARKTLSTLTRMTASQASRPSSTTLPLLLTPTLLSRMSSLPNRSSAAATMPRH